MGKKRNSKQKRKLSESSLDFIWEECFSKKYEFPVQVEEGGFLLDSQIEDYCLFMKNEKCLLNKVKSQLNSIDILKWHKHTSKTHKCGAITYDIKNLIKGELVTQAWTKFYTILSNYTLVKVKDEFKTLHLCEAPGAFVTSLNHYIQSNFKGLKWVWTANTLNPYYEGNKIGKMIIDDRLIIETFTNWDFTEHFTGDIMCKHSFEYLTKKYQDIDLITADGSIDCSENPGEQELIVLPLILWETVTALSILSDAGSFVLKIFTVFEKETVLLLFLLWDSFKHVSFIKPGPSKPGNSEVYVICTEFLQKKCKNNKLFVDLKTSIRTESIQVGSLDTKLIAKSFFEFLKSYVEISINLQTKAITDNLYLYETQTRNEDLQEIRYYISRRFIKEYLIYQIDNYVAPLLMLVAEEMKSDIPFKVGSYEDRLKGTMLLNYSSFEYPSIVANYNATFKIQCNLKYLQMDKFITGKKYGEITYSSYTSFILLKHYQDAMQRSNVVVKNSLLSIEDLQNSSQVYTVCSRLKFEETFSSLSSIILFYHLPTFLKSTQLVDIFEESNILLLNLEILNSNKKVENLTNLLFCLKCIGNFKNLVVRLDGLILCSFWAGLMLLLGTLFSKLCYKISPQGEVTITFIECNNKHEGLVYIQKHVENVINNLIQLPDELDILFTVPVYTLMQSDFRKYIRERNHYIINELKELYLN